MKMLFRACRILSRKDSEFQTTVLKRNMGIVSKAGKELDTSERSSSSHQRIQKDRRHGSGRHMNRVVAENWPSGSSWDSCAEDYIVFHIREDGAINVVEEGEQEASGPLHQIREYSRCVNGKLDFMGKSAESAQQSGESNENEKGTASRDLVISENETKKIGQQYDTTKARRMKEEQMELKEDVQTEVMAHLAFQYWDGIGLAARWKCHAQLEGSPGPTVFVFAASNSEQEKDEEQKDSMFASASSLMFA